MVIGKKLRDRHNSSKSCLRLEIVGEPNWPDYEDQGRFELWHDQIDNILRASQPVTASDETRNTPLADHKAALDIGADNLVACAITTGENTYTKVVSCPNDSTRRREKLPGCSLSYGKADTVANVSGGCTGNGHAAAITLKKHCVVT
jgi:transposase